MARPSTPNWTCDRRVCVCVQTCSAVDACGEKGQCCGTRRRPVGRNGIGDWDVATIMHVHVDAAGFPLLSSSCSRTCAAVPHPRASCGAGVEELQACTPPALPVARQSMVHARVRPPVRAHLLREWRATTPRSSPKRQERSDLDPVPEPSWRATGEPSLVHRRKPRRKCVVCIL